MALCCESLDGNADAVEFCPTPSFHNILAAATYTLLQQEDPPLPQPSRRGTLSFFALEEKGGECILHQLQHIETSGILDIKWKQEERRWCPCLAQASADGSLRLYIIQEGSKEEGVAWQLSGCTISEEPPWNSFQMIERVKHDISSSMCLSLDWDPFDTHGKAQISVSLSDGCLAVVDLGDFETVVISSGQAHGFEAWSVAYDKWKPHLVYSGGDDCHFCGWDPRHGFQHPVFRDKRTHQMGICSIHSNPHREHELATGSYDEMLRLWDVRMLEKPVMAKSLMLGGGVWRLKWHPLKEGLLLAACMHSGFKIVNVGEGTVVIVKEYHRHESLAYGADWFKGAARSSFATCTDFKYGVRINNALDISERSLKINRGETGLAYEQEDVPSSLSQKPATTNLTEEMRCIVATCSFYDRALHVWEMV